MKKKFDIRYFEDLVEHCEGVPNMAVKLNLHPRTIERWRKIGIPDDYWPELHEHFGVLPIECFKVNGKILGYSVRNI